MKMAVCLTVVWMAYPAAAGIVTATQSAAEVKMAEALSDSKAFNVNQKNEMGQTPLHLAAEKGQKEIVEMLLEKGADVNATDKEGRTPLHDAVFYRHYEIAKILLQHHSDPAKMDRAGNTPLHLYLEQVENKKGYPKDTNLILLLTP